LGGGKDRPARAAARPVDNPFVAELVLTPGPSNLLTALVLVLHLLALGIPLGLHTLPLWLQGGLLIAIPVSLGWNLLLCRQVLPRQHVRQLYWREFGGWEMVCGDGRQFPVILCNSSFSSLSISLLNFRTRSGRHYHCWILPDNVPLSRRQHLRRRMKLLSANGGSPPD